MREIVDYLLMNIRHVNSVPITFLKVSMRFLISISQKVSKAMSKCIYDLSNEIDIDRCPRCKCKLDWSRWHRCNDEGEADESDSM